MKKIVSLVLAISLLLVCPAGCESAGPEKETGPVTLRVVTELGTDATHGGTSGAMVLRALNSIVSAYRSAHPEVQIKLEYLPNKKGSEREAVLQSIRTEIMSGAGPDVFLLPAGAVAGDWKTSDYEEQEVLDPLFKDVEQSIRNHMFLDISSYYDNDAELKTEELQQSIMAAGVYEGRRYVLPIGYSMPVMIVDNRRSAELGIDPAVYSGSFYGLLDALMQTGSAAAALPGQASKVYRKLSLLPDVIDYDAGSPSLTEDLVAEYITRYQAIRECRTGYIPAGGFANWLHSYLTGYRFSLNGDVPFSPDELYRAADMVGIARYEGVDAVLLPLRDVGGLTTAEVSYYGAVNAGCSHPQAAYEFLRMFLLPEVQFQTGYGSDFSTAILWDDVGWPVRLPGSVSAKWEAAKQSASADSDPELRNAVNTVTVSDSDIPWLADKIDRVHFTTPLTYQFREDVYLPFDPVSPEEIRRLARDFMVQVNYHVAES